VRLEVLVAAGIKMTVFWVLVLCSLVEVYQYFRDTAASIIREITKPCARNQFETMVNFYQTIRHNNRE
jgi:hypothetical protein